MFLKADSCALRWKVLFPQAQHRILHWLYPEPPVFLQCLRRSQELSLLQERLSWLTAYRALLFLSPSGQAQWLSVLQPLNHREPTSSARADLQFQLRMDLFPQRLRHCGRFVRACAANRIQQLLHQVLYHELRPGSYSDRGQSTYIYNLQRIQRRDNFHKLLRHEDSQQSCLCFRRNDK